MWKENVYVEVYVSSQLVKHYQKLGYDCLGKGKMNVLQDHLPKMSRVEVSLMCDCCGNDFNQMMMVYTKKKINNKFVTLDHCGGCKGHSSKLINNYTGHSKENYYNDYKYKFEERGYEILVNQIPDKNFKVSYKCINHPDKILEITLTKFDSGRGCRYCGKESMADKQRLTLEQATQRFSEKGFTLLAKEYLKNNIKMPYICNKHPEFVQYASLDKVKELAHVCNHCALEARSGENHHNWNGGISEVRIALRYDLRNWVFDSLKRHNFKCCLSDTAFKNEHVHHYFETFENILQSCFTHLKIEPRELKADYTNPEYVGLRDLMIAEHYKIGFGIPIAPEIHVLFHRLYGSGGNTPQQFDEFTLRYKLGEFNDTQALPKKLWSK